MELLLIVIVLHSLSLCQAGPYRPRLSQTCHGTLGVDDQGKWVAVNLKSSSPQVEREIMDQICKDLGCGGLYNFTENNSASANTCLTDCTAMNSTLYNCTAAAQANCSSTTEILCERQIVRLINGKDRCAGRVELLDSGLWGSVCDDDWDFKASKVVCRQLGCGTPLIITVNNSRFGQGSGPIHISKMNCTGAERNLWQCSTYTQITNYCGHKEDAGVVCSESMDKPVTTMQTITSNQTNWTTEFVTTAFEDISNGPSASVMGCIVLSVALVFALFLIAAQCIYYKNKNMHTSCRIHQSQLMMATTMVQTSTELRRTSHEDQSDTSSEDSKHYIFPLATENPHSTQIIEKRQDDQCRTSTKSSGHNKTPITLNNIKHDQDSESTSSEECYENTNDEEQNFFNPAVSQVYPVQSTDLQTAALYHIKEAVNGKFDSASTSSDECYENTGRDAESYVQTLKENSPHPVQPLVSHNNPLITKSASLPRDQDESSTSSEEAYQNPPDSDDVNCYDMPPDQTSSEGDYDDVANW